MAIGIWEAARRPLGLSSFSAMTVTTPILSKVYGAATLSWLASRAPSPPSLPPADETKDSALRPTDKQHDRGRICTPDIQTSQVLAQTNLSTRTNRGRWVEYLFRKATLLMPGSMDLFSGDGIGAAYEEHSRYGAVR